MPHKCSMYVYVCVCVCACVFNESGRCRLTPWIVQSVAIECLTSFCLAATWHVATGQVPAVRLCLCLPRTTPKKPPQYRRKETERVRESEMGDGRKRQSCTQHEKFLRHFSPPAFTIRNYDCIIKRQGAKRGGAGLYKGLRGVTRTVAGAVLPQQAKWAAILCADCWRQFYVLEKQHALPLRAQLSSARRRAQRTAGTGRLQTARTTENKR